MHFDEHQDEERLRGLRALGLLAAVFFAALLIRAPLTITGSLEPLFFLAFPIGAADFSRLMLVPAFATALFALAAPGWSRVFGLRHGVTAALLLLAAASLMRTAASWSVLLAGSALLGVGAALLLVLLPVHLKWGLRGHEESAMGFYAAVLGLSGMAGALGSFPLLRMTGSLTGVLMALVPAAAVAAFLWILWGRIPRSAVLEVIADEAARTGFRDVARLPALWLLVAMTALERVLSFTLSDWMPLYWAAGGMRPAQYAPWFFLYLACALPGALLAPFLMRRLGGSRTALVLTSLLLLGIILWQRPGWALWPGTLCAGAAGGGMLALVFLFTAQKCVKPSEMVAVLSIAQAAAIPAGMAGSWIFGALLERTDGFAAPFAWAASAAALWGVAALLASKFPALRAPFQKVS